jgi:LacI family transcriptional regulator
MTRKFRIVDVAIEAGVSTGTVSRVLNNEPSVTENRRRAVLAAVKKLGYRPNPIARALRSGSTRMLGVIVGTLRTPSVAEFVETVLETVRAEGYAVSIADLARDPQSEHGVVSEMIERQFDGIVTLNPRDHELFRDAQAAGMQVTMVVSGREGRRYPQGAIVADLQTPGFEMFEHLYSLGHRRANYIVPAGTVPSPTLVPAAGQLDLQWIPDPADTGDDEGGASSGAIVGRVLAGDATALVMRASVAPATLQSLQREGIRIPRDVSVALWGQVAWRALVDPPLASVEVDYHRVGRVAGERMLAQLRGEPAKRACILAGRYVTGESVGPAPAKVLVR